MSQNVRLTVTLRLAPQAELLLGTAAASLCSSADLMRLALSLRGSAQLPAAVHTLLTDPRLADLAARAGPEIAAELGEVLGRPAHGRDVAAVGRLLANLGRQMAALERSAVAVLAADALAELGYVVSCEHGEWADGVEAWQADNLMLLAVTDGGHLISDQAGADGACEARQSALEEGLRRRGVSVTSDGVDKHDQTIGPLIAAAASTGETSLARAVARHSAPGGSPRGRAARDRGSAGPGDTGTVAQRPAADTGGLP